MITKSKNEKFLLQNGAVQTHPNHTTLNCAVVPIGLDCTGKVGVDGVVEEVPISDEQLAEQAQSEMITELNWVDLQLKYHSTGDTERAISTVELLNAYAIDCRDYVQNVDGVLTIVGDKPERPE